LIDSGSDGKAPTECRDKSVNKGWTGFIEAYPEKEILRCVKNRQPRDESDADYTELPKARQFNTDQVVATIYTAIVASASPADNV
jgi:hypothetical protein